MEQLDGIIKFSANVRDKDGHTHPFYFSVSKPVVEDESASYCMLLCPYLRDQAFKIYGVDEDQAIELSIGFIADMLEGQALLDDDGNKISLPKQ